MIYVRCSTQLVCIVLAKICGYFSMTILASSRALKVSRDLNIHQRKMPSTDVPTVASYCKIQETGCDDPGACYFTASFETP